MSNLQTNYHHNKADLLAYTPEFAGGLTINLTSFNDCMAPHRRQAGILTNDDRVHLRIYALSDHNLFAFPTSNEFCDFISGYNA